MKYLVTYTYTSVAGMIAMPKTTTDIASKERLDLLVNSGVKITMCQEIK